MLNLKISRKVGVLAGALTLTAGMGLSQPAAAFEPFIGQIQMFGFNFAPRGWAFCDGQLLPISSNTALFSLLGTTFGGDGRTTFGLPDLRGRSAVHPGSGPGLPPVIFGQRGGQAQLTLTVNQLPNHSHTATTAVTVAADLKGTDAAGDTTTPGGNSLASKGRTNIYKSAAPDVALHADSIAATATATTTVDATGGNQAVDIRNPYLGIYHSIALTGVFPSRS